jgi:hypothetical protein
MLAVFRKFYAFFWVIPRRLNFICRRFGTLYPFHLLRRIGANDYVKLFTDEEQIALFKDPVRTAL